ncbi:DUF4097 family beta strand repeat-containing protein [Actinomadura parmotrematis]|uniref:DUF4097 domain-containing protein n=1 Tax=Actinomadura parmotrematis TaxID=2864039 RepID=A0ABS7FXX3_9ACTN|nr:DUF4097 family beta strand repeat-containing protein [Actinomadura parmotrematis]MBW8485278.1 DUF4097 domain-containing protein [Actinomadura parmotrematis]
MHTFAATTPVTAVLNVPAGRVQVIAADRADATVEVRPATAGKSRDARTAERTTVTCADGVLRVDVPADRGLKGGGSVEVTVRLPAGSRVQGTSAAAELRGVGRLGDVAFDGAYRSVKLDETAALTLTATDGDVEVGRLGGPARISVQRGDITIAEATGGEVALDTKDGDITIAAAAGVSAALDAGTSHGRVSNALKNDGAPALDIRATTVSGDITARSL